MDALNNYIQFSTCIHDDIISLLLHLCWCQDHFTLACLQSACMECKSLVIALALVGRFINFEQAKVASRVEEEFQIEIWGVVEGGHDMVS